MGNWKIDITWKTEQIGFLSQQIRKVWKKSYNDPPALFCDIFGEPIVCYRTVCKGVILLIKRRYLCWIAVSSLRAAWVYGNQMDEQYVRTGNRRRQKIFVQMNQCRRSPFFTTKDIWLSKDIVESNTMPRSLVESTLSKTLLPIMWYVVRRATRREKLGNNSAISFAEIFGDKTRRNISAT